MPPTAAPSPLPVPQLVADLRVPLYQQIVVILRERILSGTAAPGDSLPGEAELAASFGVSRITAKRALDELAAAGLVERARGRGTRVRARPELPGVGVPLEGWLENAQAMARMTRAEVLEFGYVPAPREVAAALGLGPGARVQRAVRRRRLGGEPMSHLVTHVPEDIGRSFDAADLGAQPLLALLERAGVPGGRGAADDLGHARRPRGGRGAGHPAGAPLIEVVRTVRDETGRGVEHIRVLYRPDVWRIEMTLRRVDGAGGPRWRTEAAAPGELAEGGTR